ncbi:MAG: hypothetical protein EOO27_38905 [Comamonadaceae bacterium]|nr:MAG: hypothetical protein EOO27_38905 [Comamonadaceae bacterium]
MTQRLHTLCAAIALGCALAAPPALAADTAPGAAAAADPVATQKALGALLAAANDTIPRASSCHGDFGQTGKAKVKDLLAMRMAYLYAGTNVIEGSCSKAAQCTVTIRHAAGEDVASAAISFAVSAGKARVSSLQCVITP